MEWLVYLLISSKPATKLLTALRKNFTVLIMLIVFIVVCFICLDNAKVGQFGYYGQENDGSGKFGFLINILLIKRIKNSLLCPSK